MHWILTWFGRGQEGEEAWFMLGRTSGITPPQDVEAAGSSSTRGDWVDDVNPRSLADSDSQFLECGAVTVHLKEAHPPVSPPPPPNTHTHTHLCNASV